MPTTLYIVVDTNFLIDQLDVLKRFTKDLEDLSTDPSFPAEALGLKIIIPSMVLSELDGYDNLCSVIDVLITWLTVGLFTDSKRDNARKMMGKRMSLGSPIPLQLGCWRSRRNVNSSKSRHVRRRFMTLPSP